jgi:hypothetical protein
MADKEKWCTISGWCSVLWSIINFAVASTNLLVAIISLCKIWNRDSAKDTATTGTTATTSPTQSELKCMENILDKMPSEKQSSHRHEDLTDLLSKHHGA